MNILRTAAVFTVLLLNCFDAALAEDSKANLSNREAPNPEVVGRVEVPRDMSLFQIEPTVVDERKWEAPLQDGKKFSFYFSYDAYLEHGHQ